MECERRGLLYIGSPNNVEVRLYMAGSRHHTNGANIQTAINPKEKIPNMTIRFISELKIFYSGGASVSVCSWNENKSISSHWARHHVPTGGLPILIFWPASIESFQKPGLRVVLYCRRHTSFHLFRKKKGISHPENNTIGG